MSARRVLRTGGLYFDGMDDYVEVPHSESLNLNVLTVTAWMRSTYSGDWFRTIVAKYGYTGITESWGLGWVRPNILGFYIRDKAAIRNIASAEEYEGLDGSWHFLVGVASDSQVQFWMDGMLKRAVSRTAGDIRNTRPVTIARHLDTYVPATIDKVRIYNRALTADEIRAIYERDALIRDGLVLHLDFTEYEGNIAYDKSGCGNHATIYGARWVVKKQLRTLPETR